MSVPTEEGPDDDNDVEMIDVEKPLKRARTDELPPEQHTPQFEQNRILQEQLALTRQVIKNAAAETRRMFQDHMFRFVDQEMTKLQKPKKKLPNKYGPQPDDWETEMYLLRAEKDSLIKEAALHSREVKKLRDLLWAEQQKRAVADAELQRLKESSDDVQKTNFDLLNRLQDIKGVIASHAHVLHAYPELLSLLKSNVVDIPSAPSSLQSSQQ